MHMHVGFICWQLPCSLLAVGNKGIKGKVGTMEKKDELYARALQAMKKWIMATDHPNFLSWEDYCGYYDSDEDEFVVIKPVFVTENYEEERESFNRREYEEAMCALLAQDLDLLESNVPITFAIFAIKLMRDDRALVRIHYIRSIEC